MEHGGTRRLLVIPVLPKVPGLSGRALLLRCEIAAFAAACVLGKLMGPLQGRNDGTLFLENWLWIKKISGILKLLWKKKVQTMGKMMINHGMQHGSHHAIHPTSPKRVQHMLPKGQHLLGCDSQPKKNHPPPEICVILLILYKCYITIKNPPW